MTGNPAVTNWAKIASKLNVRQAAAVASIEETSAIVQPKMNAEGSGWAKIANRMNAQNAP